MYDFEFDCNWHSIFDENSKPRSIFASLVNCMTKAEFFGIDTTDGGYEIITLGRRLPRNLITLRFTNREDEDFKQLSETDLNIFTNNMLVVFMVMSGIFSGFDDDREKIIKDGIKIRKPELQDSEIYGIIEKSLKLHEEILSKKSEFFDAINEGESDATVVIGKCVARYIVRSLEEVGLDDIGVALSKQIVVRSVQGLKQDRLNGYEF